MQYRFCLLDQDNHIEAAETFSSPDDATARETAVFVYDACNDEFESYELWRGDERVAGCGGRANAAGELRLSDVVSARQENILDLEDRLQQTSACVRRSRKLLEATATLRSQMCRDNAKPIRPRGVGFDKPERLSPPKAGQRSTTVPTETRAEPRRSGQKRFVRTAFGREIVDIDGAEFLECAFRGTTLRYGGGEVPRIVRCTFSDTCFAVEGAAARTLAFLQAMASRGSGVQQVVREMFPAMFAN